MKQHKHFSNLMGTARRALALAALLVFAAAAGATWMDSSRAEARANQSYPGNRKSEPLRSSGSPAPWRLDAPLSTESRPGTNHSRAQTYKAGDEPLTKNGKVLTGKLNINTATEDQLRMLPGIGPAKAQRVLAYRKKYGKFKRVRDLRRVKGFGYKTVKKLSGHLTVEGKSTLRAE